MKKTLLSSAILAVVFAVCLFVANRQAAAQAPAAGAQGLSGIALVDVNYIFKKHARLKSQLTELQADATKVQKEFEEQLQRLQEQAKQLSTLKPGTPDYQRMEESLVSQKAVIQGRVALMRKEFVQKEAKLYFNAYREISDEVTYYCQQRGISLVLNFNGDQIKDDNPDDVARGISNKVVFYNKAMDITPHILPRFAGNPDTANRNNGPTGVFAPQK